MARVSPMRKRRAAFGEARGRSSALDSAGRRIVFHAGRALRLDAAQGNGEARRHGFRECQRRGRSLFRRGAARGARDRLHQFAGHGFPHLGRGRAAPRLGLSHRALRQARARAFRIARRPRADGGLRQRSGGPARSLRGKRRGDRRPVDRRPDRAGTLSPASRSRRRAHAVRHRRRKSARRTCGAIAWTRSRAAASRRSPTA